MDEFGNCKKCETLECWVHGQVEKPDDETLAIENKKEGGRSGGNKPRAAKKTRDARKRAANNGQGGGGGGGGGGGMAWPSAAAQGWGMNPDMMAMMMQMMGGCKGAGKGFGKVQKHNQKQQSGYSDCEHPKNKLGMALRLLLESDATKDDCKYEFVEDENKQYTATLYISRMDRVFQGPPSRSKKEAETEVARVAVEALEESVKPIRDARDAGKSEKKKASLVVFKEMHRRKDEERKALKIAKAEGLA